MSELQGLLEYGVYAFILGLVVRGIILHLINENKELKENIKERDGIIEKKNNQIIEREKEFASTLKALINKQDYT